MKRSEWPKGICINCRGHFGAHYYGEGSDITCKPFASSPKWEPEVEFLEVVDVEDTQ
jgi:hypothetical protein